MLSSRHLLFFHFRHRHSDWKVRTSALSQRAKELSVKLNELNECDKQTLLHVEKERIVKTAPLDYKNTIENISDLDFLKQINYIFTIFPFSKKSLSLEEKINLRSTVNNTIRLYDINEDTFKLLMDVLEKHQVLPKEKS